MTELLEVAAWPLATLIGVIVLGIVGMFLFRTEVAGFIKRTRKIGRDGVETQIVQQEPDDRKASPSDELMRSFDNELLVRQEQLLTAEFEEKAVNLPPQERERLLFRLLAAATIGRHFETVYRTIFGSQISALEFLNSESQHTATTDSLRPWYKRAATENPDFYETYPFESWVQYLAGFNLIILMEDRVAITLEGREFLKFVLQMRYPFHKAG